MKVKVVEITETDAKIQMLRMDTAAMFMLIMAMMVMIAVILSVPEGLGLSLAWVAVGVLLVTSAAWMGISSFCKSRIQALNIIDWPIKKYVLKDTSTPLFDVKRRN